MRQNALGPEISIKLVSLVALTAVESMQHSQVPVRLQVGHSYPDDNHARVYTLKILQCPRMFAIVDLLYLHQGSWYLIGLAQADGDYLQDLDGAGVDLAEERGLDPAVVAVGQLEDLEGDCGTDEDLLAEVAEIDGLLCHLLIYIIRQGWIITELGPFVLFAYIISLTAMASNLRPAKNNLATILVLTLVVLACAEKPTPKCEPKFYYQTLPMIPNQSAILNLDSLFDGFNLNFELQGQDQWAKYITLNDKLKLLKKQIPDTPLIGLKSYHLEKVGNSWGSSFVAMSERGERTFLSYGFLGSNTSAPVINNDVRVENFTNTTCFDAVIFPREDVMIVDCAVKLASPDEQGYHYVNQFYYFRISDGSKTNVIRNQMFIPFTKITRRKMQLYTQVVSGNTYLLRSYMYDGVDEEHENNTYVDVHMVTKPREPWIVAVIDRSFLGMSTLRAADIRVYLSQIYVLDYTKGLHRIRINTEQDLIYSGFYEAKGFDRFAVYSNNLDDRFQLALANGHEVYQIDWSNLDDPILLNKYSLMPNSNLRQVFINERFVVVLAAAVDNGQEYNYTWVLSRGDRTYTKAFQVIKHDTANTFVDLNLDESYLMIIDDEKIANYAVDQAILTLTLKKDEDFLDRMMSFTIKANSYEPTSQETLTCSFVFNFTLLEDNNRTMWPVGAEPSPYYNANYPGKVVIPLYSYVLGPNITYRVTEVSKGQLKKYKILQQDQLTINWEKKPPVQNLVFLRTETINRADSDILLLYTQDKQNDTFATVCYPNHEDTHMLCNYSAQLKIDGAINNWATTIFVSSDTLQGHHVAAYTTTKHYNKVVVDDVGSTERVIELDLAKGYAGNATNVQTYGKYMFVIKKYVKTIMIYDLELVIDGFDEPICSITHDLMYRLGVKYFSPELVETSSFYPNVLFIKSSDSIIVLDLNKECSPKLLSIIKAVENTLTQFSFMLTLSHLVVTAMPNTIVEYDLSRVYLKDIKKTKTYPVYGYKLPKNYDTDVSEYGNSMFITMVSEGGDYQVFVYRAGYPGVAALYDVIDLYTYESILIDASGSFIDYVAVYSGSQLRIFREYEIPVAQISNVEVNYQFWLEYYNVVTSIKLELISVSIINLPTLITVNPEVNDIMKTKDLLFSGPDRISEIDDHDWYDGNVLTIKTDCRDCDGKVTVRNHIYKEGDFQLIPGLVDYDWTNSGGSLQVYDAVLQMNHHGTVRDFVHLPQSKGTVCLSATAPLHSRYQVSACIQGKGVNLYLTSLISHKGFAFAPYSSKAEQLLKIEAVNQLLILVDTSTNAFFKSRPGGVILYALNFDTDRDEAFEQIQYIDYSDFAASDKPEYVVNADLSYHPETKTYRLYITEITKGIYEISFKFNSILKGITILHVNYINVPALLAKAKANPPYDATYQAVKVVESSYDTSLEQSRDLVVLTTGVYHIVLLEVVLDVGHVAIQQSIKKFLSRYAYYVVENQIRYVNGLIVIRQTLPQEYEDVEDQGNKTGKAKSKQLITVYDIKALPFKPTPAGQVPQVGLIGAQMIDDRNNRGYDFNLTYNPADLHPEPRVNLVIVHEFSNVVDQMSLHRNLTVHTADTVDTQIIYLDLINDFDMKKIRILLNGWAPYPEWKLIAIILFSIIGFLILSAGAVVGLKKFKAYRAQMQPPEQQQRGSLMTQEKTTERDSYGGYGGDRYSSSYSYS